MGNVEKALFYGLPTYFVECAGPTQLVKGLFFKDYFKDKIFAFAGLIHHPKLDKEAQSQDFVKQLERYFATGFDGLKMLEGKPMVCICHSWLLFPEYKNILLPKSNIVSFMGDFDIFASHEQEKFEYGWRVFADKSELTPKKLPENTSLQKAFN